MRSASLDVDEFISSRTVLEEFDYLFVSGSAFLRRSDALGHVPAIIANDALLRNSTLYLKVREPFLRNAFPLAALVNWSNRDELCHVGVRLKVGESTKIQGVQIRYGRPDVVQMRDVEKACDDRAFGSPMEYGQNIHAARL